MDRMEDDVKDKKESMKTLKEEIVSEVKECLASTSANAAVNTQVSGDNINISNDTPSPKANAILDSIQDRIGRRNNIVFCIM
ncbi:hypothetical protein DPMN_168362 [Dreissena polymorpha]|uniref:Uncharacterized protein n=1 Tax=Dreissena polymorpha TaxID=45954 RepID=A0A9D4F1M0_DREPO|nr:hypothetical protein DPMN_168362 [Dreissena polymorpha]